MTDRIETEPQDVDAPMTTAAAFLVLNVTDGDQATSTARSVVASTEDLIKDVRIRANGRPSPATSASPTMSGIGSPTAGRSRRN